MTLTVRSLTGAEILAAIDDLGRLRTTVFAAWPYLYEGSPDYEAEYLREFVAAPDGVLVAAYAGDRIVGAATASPMRAQEAAFRVPFEQRGIDIATLFYFGESVLLPEWRGQGVGHAFFDHREVHAARCGATATAFAAVIRPDDHPARPAGYAPLDPFWRKRGYAPVPGLVTALSWQDHDERVESPKPMQCWMRSL